MTTVFVTHDQEEAMEVADRIVVMDQGAIEQIGAPRDALRTPGNEFVMGSSGRSTASATTYVRPHDIELRAEPNGITSAATVERLVHLGFEVRVELEREDGERISAQVTRDVADELGLEPGSAIFVRPTNERVFSQGGAGI